MVSMPIRKSVLTFSLSQRRYNNMLLTSVWRVRDTVGEVASNSSAVVTLKAAVVLYCR